MVCFSRYCNHPLIMRSKTSLDSSEFLVRGFWSWFCKLTLFDTPNGRSKCVLEFFLAQTKQDHGPLTPIVTNNNNCKVWCFGLEFSNFGWKYTDFVAYVAPLTTLYWSSCKGVYLHKYNYSRVSCLMGSHEASDKITTTDYFVDSPAPHLLFFSYRV